MILAGDKAQVQFAIVGIYPHLSGPRGSVTSPGAISLSGTRHSRAHVPTPDGRRRPTEIDRRYLQPIPVRSNAPPVRPRPLPPMG